MSKHSKDDQRAALIRSITDLEEDTALGLTRERLEAGDDPLQIIEDCRQGMRKVGQLYAERKYYLAGLIMAGEIFQETMELLQPRLRREPLGQEAGLVLLGTVSGDLHNIGKSILHVLLRCYNFAVEDLGVDVPPEAFLERFQAMSPDVVGLSGLLTSSFDSMKDTIRLLRAADLGPKVPIIIGGGLVNEEACRYTQADFWTADAMEGVRICQKVVPSSNK